jgi:hypothetical protein
MRSEPQERPAFTTTYSTSSSSPSQLRKLGDSGTLGDDATDARGAGGAGRCGRLLRGTGGMGTMSSSLSRSRKSREAGRGSMTVVSAGIATGGSRFPSPSSAANASLRRRRRPTDEAADEVEGAREVRREEMVEGTLRIGTGGIEAVEVTLWGIEAHDIEVEGRAGGKMRKRERLIASGADGSTLVA